MATTMDMPPHPDSVSDRVVSSSSPDPAPQTPAEVVVSAPVEQKTMIEAAAPLSPPLPSPVLPVPTHSEPEPEKKEKSEQQEQTDSSKRPLDATEVKEEAAPEDSLPKHQSKFALSMLKSLKRLKDAYPFLAPVDPVKLNIPDYFKFITSPMDLSTMEKKVIANQYSSIDAFVADFNLIVENCIKFNGPESKIADMGRSIKASFERQLKQMPPADMKPEPASKKRKVSIGKTDSEQFALTPSGMPIIRRDSAAAVDSTGRPKREIHPPKPKDLPYTESKPRRKKYAAELRFCQTVLKELTSKKYEAFSFPFLQPVDPVALNCPTYFKVIKEPMDLSTIEKKLNMNQYESGAEFEEDIRLMFRNCYKFNPEASPVNVMGRRLELMFDKKWAEKPAPLPDKQVSESEDDDDDESEEDSDDDDNADKTISLLEQQLLAMQSQLVMMKKQKKDSSKKKKKDKGLKKATKKRKPSVPAQAPFVTYEMKKELSEKINTLSQTKMNHVIKMIRDSMPQIRGQDEIELDVDQLDPATVIKLYNFVTKNSPVTSTKQMTPVAQKPKKKGKSEQKKQMEHLQKQLKSFKDGGSSDESSSDDDSAESESSSEEE
ncbi:Bromodomain-containing protein [Lipomyces arxii]|uniref:Bromodomain-containing protein n=1 Tax=Lipomyces arxii TaxID=56418 RepID=UPI0034CD7E5F